MTGAAYSAYEYDYVGGVFSGSKFTFTTVPTGATYSSYETDYDQAAYLRATHSSSPISGQCYTGEEEDFDASGAFSRVVLTGIAGQAYCRSNSITTPEPMTATKPINCITGQPYTSEEVDVSAANQIEKVVYSGMTSTPYSSVEEDYSGGALADAIYNFTNVTGRATIPIRSRKLRRRGEQETFDLNSGGHNLIALTSGQTLTSLGDDKMTGRDWSDDLRSQRNLRRRHDR